MEPTGEAPEGGPQHSTPGGTQEWLIKNIFEEGKKFDSGTRSFFGK